MSLIDERNRFPFRSFKGEEPTTEELRVELEKVYDFLEKKGADFAATVEPLFAVHDEVLTANGEIVFADGDVVMVIGVPNT